MIISSLVFGVLLLVGLWGLTCLVSAMIQQGGPIKLFQRWWKAINGR